MRAFLFIAAFALLSLASVVQAQDGELPPCSTAEIATMHDSVSGIYKLFQSASDMRTMDDLLEYSQDHLEWRERQWLSWPKCSRGFDIALLANQLIGDYVTLILMNSLAEDFDENPYVPVRKSGVARLEALWNEVPLPGEPVDAPSAGEIRGCTSSERQFIRDTLLPEYDHLTNIANSVEDVKGFHAYGKAQLVWRQDSLPRYPPCAESIEIAWWASQTAGDIAALFAFYAIGLPEDEIPYSAPERQGTRRLRELRENLLNSPEGQEDAGALPDEVMRAIERELGNPSGGNWRRCTVEELETIQNILPTYQSLEDMAAGIETIDDLLAYSRSQVLWRENLHTKLARCGEVLEIAWLISENIGDLAIMYALKFIDIPVDESPVFQQVMSNVPGINTWEGLLPTLLASYEQSDGVKPLPACTAEELGVLKTILTAHLDIFKTHGDIRSIDDLQNFVIHQLAWREFFFSQLPLCYGSFETFLRAYWYASDNAVGIALALAGVTDDASPYPEQQSIGKSHIESWYAIVDGVVSPPSAETAVGSPES